MRRKILVALAVSGIGLSGCVGRLETTPYRERTDTLGAALTGVSYSLPKLQYEVKLTRSLVECPGEREADLSPRLIDGQPTTLKFAIEAKETAAYVPGEAYAVNYEKLPGFLRTGSFEIKYWPNGNLKSIGAGAEDKTADFIRDTVKTGLSLASIAGGPLTSDPRPTTRFVEERTMGCTAEAMMLVTEARELRKGLKARPKVIEKLSKDVERFQARAALRLRDPRDREDLINLFNAIDAEQEWVTSKTERLAEIAEQLGVTETIRWDSKAGAITDQVWTHNLSEAQKNKIAALLQPVDAPAPTDARQGERQRIAGACYGSFPEGDALELKKRNCVIQHLNLTAQVEMVSDLRRCGTPGATKPECIDTVTPHVPRGSPARQAVNPRYRDARDDRPDSGIFVREPATARLLFCRTAVLPLVNEQLGPCTLANDEGKLKQAYFPQYGQLRYLPLRVGTFQAREMALSLAEDGRIETFSYKSTKSAGAALAAAAADAASQADAALEKIETERRDDRKYAFDHANDAIQERINQLTKEAEERKLTAPPAPANPLQPQLDQLAGLQTEVALLELTLKKNDLLKMGIATPPTP